MKPVKKIQNRFSTNPKKRFINRELSWLAFNERVLEEALNTSHPLLERVKFLSISASNLDEFFMVRVAGLKSQILHSKVGISKDGLTPEEQLQKIYLRIDDIIAQQQRCWEQLKGKMEQEKIHIVSPKDFSKSDKAKLEEYFIEHILNELTPIDMKYAYNSLVNLGVSIVLELEEEDDIIIPLPYNTERFISLPAKKGEIKLALLEDVLGMFKQSLLIGKLFPGSKVKGSGIMRILRDGELYVTDKADDLVSSFETALKRRERGSVVRLKVSDDMPETLKDNIARRLGVEGQSVAQGSELLGMKDLTQLYELDKPDLKFKPHHIRFPERIDDYGGDCFAAIAAKDIVVHHPYESFDVVVQFIRQAARDHYVTEIKQTLYRTSSNSPIVQALIEAAEAGKDVTVVVELKARFDEKANLGWGKGLEKAGAKVIYGVDGLKTHAKTSLVIREINGKKESYVHYGTGNYHSVTARVYSDLSFFTCDAALCRDAAKLFKYMATGRKSHSYEKILVSPFSLRESIMKMIEHEKALAKEGKPANIWIKANALVDVDIIEALYDASCAGVSIDLVIRGICCLKPGVKGLSENIRVKSMVGRFLEHARIYCFGNGNRLPSPKAKVFISSADLMPRNLNRRVELMVPIENSTVHEQILNQIMVANIKDQKQSWVMLSDGTYQRDVWDGVSLSAHEFFLYNPSLSGRGSALHGVQEQKQIEATRSVSKIAVIDIGSNSVRLVVYDGLKRVPLPVFNEKTLCGLARNMEKTGCMNPEGVKLAISSLDRFMHIIRAMDVSKVYCFATSAVRDSEDGRKFAREIEKKFNMRIDVLSGKQEARLAAMGIASAFHEADGVVGDLGGGSLELAHVKFDRTSLFSAKKIVGEQMSFPIGALRIYSASGGKRQKAKEIVDSYLKQFPLNDTMNGKNFYIVGGGPRALAKIHIGRSKYPLNILQHYSAQPNEFVKTLRAVSAMSPSRINDLPSVSQSRAETLSFTALVIERIIELGKPRKIIFSTHGVREGILFDKLQPATKNQDGLICGCIDIIDMISSDGSKQWVKYGEELYNWMSPLFTDETEHMQRIRHAACILSWLAWYEHTAYRAEMAFRWVLDAELPSIDHWERAFIAMALFHRYQSNPDPKVTARATSILGKKWGRRARALGLAMRFGYHLSGSTPDILMQTKLAATDKKVIFSCRKENKSLLTGDVIKKFNKLANALKLKPEIKV